MAAKTAKIKPENTFILRKETTQKTDSSMDEEEYHLQSKFYYPEDLETSEADISESQEPPWTINRKVNVRRKNGEYEPATFSSFQRNIQRYLSEKKYPFNILKDNEFEKSRRVLAAKHKSLVHEHDRRNKLQAAQAVDENEEDALFEAGEFGDSNPVALQGTVWWFLSLHFGFRTRDESDEDG